MSQEEFNKVFSSNLTRLLEENSKSQIDLVKYVGVSKSSVSEWCKGLKTPRMDKIDKMCTYFGVTRSELMDDKNSTNEKVEHYYIDDEARDYANELKNNKELKLMFDAARDVKKEDLEIVYNMLLALKRKEQGED